MSQVMIMKKKKRGSLDFTNSIPAMYIHSYIHAGCLYTLFHSYPFQYAYTYFYPDKRNDDGNNYPHAHAHHHHHQQQQHQPHHHHHQQHQQQPQQQHIRSLSSLSGTDFDLFKSAMKGPTSVLNGLQRSREKTSRQPYKPILDNNNNRSMTLPHATAAAKIPPSTPVSPTTTTTTIRTSPTSPTSTNTTNVTPPHMATTVPSVIIQGISHAKTPV